MDRLGQMQFKGLPSRVSTNALTDAKKDLLSQLIRSGEYHLPDKEMTTKEIVKKLLEFLKE